MTELLALVGYIPKIIWAATGGAFATWLIDGDYSLRGFAQLFGSLIIAAFMAIVAVYFIPSVDNAPEIVKIGISGVVGGFASDIFKRLTNAKLSAKIGGVDISSDGDDK